MNKKTPSEPERPLHFPIAGEKELKELGLDTGPRLVISLVPRRPRWVAPKQKDKAEEGGQ